jgi:hypothetical protein
MYINSELSRLVSHKAWDHYTFSQGKVSQTWSYADPHIAPPHVRITVNAVDLMITSVDLLVRV